MFGVDPEEVYVSDSRRGGYTYHTDEGCPNLPTVYKTLTSDDPKFDGVIEREECQWCRYETLDVLELPDEDT